MDTAMNFASTFANAAPFWSQPDERICMRDTGPLAVTALIRAAACAGIQRAIVTNANGCLRDWSLGDVMIITDHMNLSGSSPFDGPLFVDISQVWDSEMSKEDA